MVKTHEKSRIYAVVGTDNVKNIGKVVLQMEATGQISGGYLIYLVETVSAEDYDRTTAEGRAAAAEKELKEYKEAFFETTDNLNAEKKRWKNYWNRRETRAAIIEGNLTKRHRKTPNFTKPLQSAAGSSENYRRK